MLTGSGLYAKIKAMVTVPAGYQYEGVSIGIDNEEGTYTSVKNKDVDIIADLLAKLSTALGESKGINEITLGDLIDAKITARLYVMKGEDSKYYTVLFK